jgi:curved DNA-binding protein
MKFVDYYGALGLPRDADLDQIKKAYRTLARQHHPDVSKAPDAEEKFKKAAAAYATLKNPEKRAAYDALGPLAEGTDLDAPPPQSRRPQEQTGAHFEDMAFADFLDGLGQGSPFGARHSRARGPQRGQDLQDTVLIELGQALSGTTLHIALHDHAERRDLEVTVPAGVRVGQKLRLRGKGGRGQHGGEDGDFYLHIGFKPHPRFRLDGQDLYFDLALSPWEAMLGADIAMPTLDGEVVLTVPPGTSSGKKLRLRGRGMPQGAGAQATRGDMFALVRVDVPAQTTPEERKLLEELARISSFTPRLHPTGTPP